MLYLLDFFLAPPSLNIELEQPLLSLVIRHRTEFATTAVQFEFYSVVKVSVNLEKL